MDPRGSPKWVRNAHLANELANLCRCLWSATLRSRFPAPIGSKAGAMPAEYRVWFEDLQSVQHPGSQTVESNKHQAVNVAEGQSLRDLRRSTLSWCRRIRISASNAARDRNSPIKAHQINLEMSVMKRSINRFAGAGQPIWVYGRDNCRNRAPGAGRGARPRAQIR